MTTRKGGYARASVFLSWVPSSVIFYMSPHVRLVFSRTDCGRNLARSTFGCDRNRRLNSRRTVTNFSREPSGEANPLQNDQGVSVDYDRAVLLRAEPYLFGEFSHRREPYRTCRGVLVATLILHNFRCPVPADCCAGRTFPQK